MHIPPPRKPAQCISFQMPSLHSCCLVEGSCPSSTILLLTGSLDFNTIIGQRRLRWLGHIHRMEDGRLPKDILYSEFYNAPRRTGRPKLRYKDVIKRDMGGFHISPQSWETLAADRNRWHASLSFGYSLSATSYAEKMEKRRAHRRQRRDGPWWWWWHPQRTRTRFTVLVLSSDEFAVHSCPLLCLSAEANCETCVLTVVLLEFSA